MSVSYRNKHDNTLKDLDLLNKVHRMEYEQYKQNVVENGDIINTLKSNLGKHIDVIDIDDDTGKAILMTYAFSRFSNKIFRPYKTSIDDQMIRLSNKIIVELSNAANGKKITDNFKNLVKRYLTLYRLWKSREDIKIISRYNDSILELAETDDVMSRLGMTVDIDKSEGKILEYYNKMININKLVTISMIQKNYDVYKKYPALMDAMWGDIMKEERGSLWDMLIIIISHIRKRCIDGTNDIKRRKKLYYNIDINDMTDKLYKKDLTWDQIKPSLSLLMDNKQMKEDDNIVKVVRDVCESC